MAALAPVRMAARLGAAASAAGGHTGLATRRAFSAAAPATPAAAAAPAAKKMFALHYTFAAATMEELIAKRAPLRYVCIVCDGRHRACVPHYLITSADCREAHLALANKWAAAGQLVMGGAYTTTPCGGLLVFSAYHAAATPSRYCSPNHTHPPSRLQTPPLPTRWRRWHGRTPTCSTSWCPSFRCASGTWWCGRLV